MIFNPLIHHRQTIRLKGSDYSSAVAYFVTICVQDREHIFGEIKNREMIVNQFGTIVMEEWLHSFQIRRELEADVFVVVPNHIHGIIWIRDPVPPVPFDVGAHGYAPSPDYVQPDPNRIHTFDTESEPVAHMESDEEDDPSDGRAQNPGRAHNHAPLRRPKSLSTFVAGFKYGTTVRINSLRKSPGSKTWERNYYEHIIRDDGELSRIREYVVSNPEKRATGPENLHHYTPTRK